jgi:hypothetical protein
LIEKPFQVPNAHRVRVHYAPKVDGCIAECEFLLALTVEVILGWLRTHDEKFCVGYRAFKSPKKNIKIHMFIRYYGNFSKFPTN